MIKQATLIIFFCALFSAGSGETYSIPWATQQPAWVFPLWFEDGSRQKDTVYLGYDPSANRMFGASDTVFGEYWHSTPDSAFFVLLNSKNTEDSISKVHISNWPAANNHHLYTEIHVRNAIWPLKIEWDVELLNADTLPVSDTLIPKIFVEFHCDDSSRNLRL